MSAAATAAGYLYAAGRLSAAVRRRIGNEHAIDVLAAQIQADHPSITPARARELALEQLTIRAGRR